MLRAPAVYVQFDAVRIVPARVSVPDGLLMTTTGSPPAAGVAEPLNVWSRVPSMSSVALPPPKVEAWLIEPRASSVPGPLRLPEVRIRLPVTVRVSPAAIDFAPEAMVRLRNDSLPGTSMVAGEVASDTVPTATFRMPALCVKAPVTVNVPDVLVNDPAARLNGPLTVIAEVPPTKLPLDWVQPPAPTVIVRPADWDRTPV